MYKQYSIQKYKSKPRSSAGWPENKESVGSGREGSRQGNDDDGGGKQISDGWGADGGRGMTRRRADRGGGNMNIYKQYSIQNKSTKANNKGVAQAGLRMRMWWGVEGW